MFSRIAKQETRKCEHCGAVLPIRALPRRRFCDRRDGPKGQDCMNERERLARRRRSEVK